MVSKKKVSEVKDVGSRIIDETPDDALVKRAIV
jgi:hypothetical protein